MFDNVRILTYSLAYKAEQEGNTSDSQPSAQKIFEEAILRKGTFSFCFQSLYDSKAVDNLS